MVLTVSSQPAGLRPRVLVAFQCAPPVAVYKDTRACCWAAWQDALQSVCCPCTEATWDSDSNKHAAHRTVGQAITLQAQ